MLERYPAEIPSTILNLAEALYGIEEFDFDSLRDRLIGGYLFASPSATAAYLMRCHGWDNLAEAYLQLVLSNGAGRCSGPVPSAYPSTSFQVV